MKIVLAADTPHWAFAKIANHIAAHSENDIETIYTSYFHNYEALARYLMLADFDVCHFFWRLYYARFIDFVAANSAFDSLLKKKFTVSVPDYALLSYDSMKDGLKITRSASGIVYTNKDLFEIYNSRFSPRGYGQIINDPLLKTPDNEDIRATITRKKHDPLQIAWVGNGNWRGAGNYADYKGLHSILDPILPALEAEGIQSTIFDSSQKRVRHSDIMAALHESHVLCMTSMFEGTSLPVLEAMASGNAIVTTNTGIFPSLESESTAASIVARNALCFLDAISALNQDRDEWEHQANANLDAIAETTQRRSVTLWDEFFSESFRSDTVSPLVHFSKSPPAFNDSIHAPNESEGIVCITTSRWHGVRNSSVTIFKTSLMVPEIPSEASLNNFDGSSLILALESEHPDSAIVISGGDDFHRKLFSDHIDFFATRHTTLLWHGSATQWQEEVHQTQFMYWNDQVTLGNLKGIAFFKEDMAEMFSLRHRPTALIKNWIPGSFNNNFQLRRKSRHRDLSEKLPIRVAVLSATDHPLKNPATQLLAAGLAYGGKLDVVVPDKDTFARIQNPFRISTIPIGGGLSQAEHSRAMEIADIVSYVTFTECSPMIPLEAAQLGIPCLVSPAANIYNGYPILEEMLLVQRPDDVMEIRRRLEAVIQYYPRIVDELYTFYETETENMEYVRDSYYRWCRGMTIPTHNLSSKNTSISYINQQM